MRKTVLAGMVVLLSGAWAAAQPSQPGFSYVNANPKPPGQTIVVPTAATPPEPGTIGATPSAAPGMAYPGYPPFPMGPRPAMQGGMGGAPMGGAMGMPAGADPGAIYGPGYANDFGPNLTLDPPSSFGTERIWVSGRYILGYLTRPRLSTPLVTTGSSTDIHPGALDQSSTRVLFGENQYQFGQLSGVQVDLGVNLNDRLYLEGSVMYFAPQHTNAIFASDAGGNPFLGRPVFNTLLGQERSYLTSSPAARALSPGCNCTASRPTPAIRST